MHHKQTVRPKSLRSSGSLLSADSECGGRKTVQVIQGSAIPQEFIPRFRFDRLVKYYEFADINRAIANARNGRTIKPVLRIR